LPSDGHLLVFASDKDTLFPNGEIHSNFKINNGNEPVVLTRSDSSMADYIGATQTMTDWSYGRYPDAGREWFYFNQPTPGGPNNTEPVADFADPPEFSHQAGFYPDDFYLEISAPNADDSIYYTLDGSPPSTDSPIYTGPLLMTWRGDEPNNLSLIRTTLPGIGFYYWGTPGSNVYKFNTVRARVIKQNFYPSKIISSSFIVDQDAQSRYTVPIISLISDSLNFFDETVGIYIAGTGIDSTDWESAHFSQRGRAWERDVHVELFEPDGLLKLSQDAGVRIHGGFTRTANLKSLRLYARSEYDDKDFDYQFFPEMEQNSFKRIMLRNAGNDVSFAFLRDAFMQSLVDDFFLDTQAYRHSIVFLNGEYWGVHYIRERYGKYYLEENYEIPTDSVDILENAHVVVEGDDVHYNALCDFILDNDMSDSVNYAYIKTQMDVENYINYAACNIFFCQSDWPQNNVKFWRKKLNAYDPDAPLGHDGRWRWLMFDTDYGFGRIKPYTYDMINFLLNVASGWSPRLIQNLTGNENKPGNEEFRNSLINTMGDLLNSNFKVDRTLAGIQHIKDLLVPEILEHFDRWNKFNSMSQWNGRIDVMINFAINRPGVVTEDIVQNFPMVYGTSNVTLASNLEMGEIKINKLTIDKNTIGLDDPVHPYPWSGTYFIGVPITLTALPNPGYEFVEWQGLSSEDTLIANLVGDTIFTAVFRAQPWKCAKPGTETIFEPVQGGQCHGLRIDSIRQQSDTARFFNYTTLREDNGLFYDGQPSWTGKYIEVWPDETVLFFNLLDDTISIKPTAEPGSSWICHRLPDGRMVEATASSVGLESFLGLEDSVRTFTFQMKDGNFNNLNHGINSMEMKLSKSFGFVKTLNFYLFPEYDLSASPPYYEYFGEMQLIGISYPMAGVQNLTCTEVYDFNPGDEIHTHQKYHDYVNENQWNDYRIFEVIEKEIISQDSVKYLISQCYRNTYQHQSQPPYIVASHDTVVTIYPQHDQYWDHLPGEPAFSLNDTEEAIYPWLTEPYLGRKVKTLPTEWFIKDQNFWGTTHCDGLCPNEYWVEGLGGPYWEMTSITSAVTWKSILLYKKGDETWGEPLLCDTLLMGIQDEVFGTGEQITVFPNPANDFVNISIACYDNQKIQFLIFSPYGQLITHQVLANTNSKIDIRNLPSGVYFYRLSNKSGIVKEGKLVKIR